MTRSVRVALVRAAAHARHLPASDFTGLEPGQTYYALEVDDSEFWAGAALVPSPGSTGAQISVQDNGSYDLFVRRRGGTWRVFDVGLAGVGGTRCPVRVAREVLEAWGWPRHSCRPPRP